jgi:hypothetical protein
METVRTSETWVCYNETIWCNIPEGSNLHTRRRENLKSHNFLMLFFHLFFVFIFNFFCFFLSVYITLFSLTLLFMLSFIPFFSSSFPSFLSYVIVCFLSLFLSFCFPFFFIISFTQTIMKSALTYELAVHWIQIMKLSSGYRWGWSAPSQHLMYDSLHTRKPHCNSCSAKRESDLRSIGSTLVKRIEVSPYLI